MKHIQNHIKCQSSPGYERWVKIYNLKEAAQTLNFLLENNITDYALLQEKAAQSAARFNELSGKIKGMESRLSEIVALKTHIVNYSKTRDIYIQYRKSGYSRKFYEEHEQKILLHKAVKQSFDNLHVEKFPTVKALQTEYGDLLTEKKKLYQEYAQAKKKTSGDAGFRSRPHEGRSTRAQRVLVRGFGGNHQQANFFSFDR
jgi:hypothetical protein